jgi:hypothetical protein
VQILKPTAQILKLGQACFYKACLFRFATALNANPKTQGADPKTQCANSKTHGANPKTQPSLLLQKLACSGLQPL